MKTFALAALAAFGLAFTAGTADAQYRARSGYSYGYPSYSYGYPSSNYSSIYNYPSSNYSAIYSYPSTSYSSYTPTYSSGVVTSSFYSPSASTVVTPTGYSTYSPTYGYTYTTPYSGNTYVAPSAGYRGRGWRR